MMINFYSFLMHWGWVLVLGFFALIGFIIYYLRTKEGKKQYDVFSLKAPLFGKLLKKIYLVRFAESVSTLISAGLSINETLRITADTIQNSVYKKIVQETGESVSSGEKISSVLIKYPDHIPLFVVQMIKVGEETGKLEKTLMEIVNFYQKEVRRTIEQITALLEPILIIFLGVMVAFLAVSVLSPLYETLGTI